MNLIKYYFCEKNEDRNKNNIGNNHVLYILRL